MGEKRASDSAAFWATIDSIGGGPFPEKSDADLRPDLDEAPWFDAGGHSDSTPASPTENSLFEVQAWRKRLDDLGARGFLPDGLPEEDPSGGSLAAASLRNVASPLIDEIWKKASERAYGCRIIANYYRSDIVEAMVSCALPNWDWCSGDWAAYDFRLVREGAREIRLEVKQTSATQTWSSKAPSVPRWDIAPRKGRYEGSVYVKEPGRKADIYVLAIHREQDRAVADHRDPVQWAFYVVSASDLPPQNGITERKLLKSNLGTAVLFDALGHEVELACRKIA